MKVYVVYWYSEYSYSPSMEIICVCSTEESAKKKCCELGKRHHDYAEYELVS